MASDPDDHREKLPDPRDGNFQPAGPARGEDISPSKTEFRGPLAHLSERPDNVMSQPVAGPQDNVTIYVAPEPQKSTTVGAWTDKQRARLAQRIAELITSDPNPPIAIARMFEQGVADGMQDDPFATEEVPDTKVPQTVVCDICGALVASISKHELFAHPTDEGE